MVKMVSLEGELVLRGDKFIEEKNSLRVTYSVKIYSGEILFQEKHKD